MSPVGRARHLCCAITSSDSRRSLFDSIFMLQSKEDGPFLDQGAQLFRNSSGNDGRQGRLIKTLGNLQDLRQGIYRKRKTEVVGRCGVDAGKNSGSKVPPIGYVP